MTTHNTAALQVKVQGGIDDILTKDPTSSLFTYTYKQISPFAKDTVFNHFLEKMDYGKTLSYNVPYTGDLLSSIILYFKLPILTIPIGSTYVGWTNTIGYALIEYVEIKIGEISIDKHYSVNMEFMDYITTNASKKESHNKNIGRYDNVNVLNINSQESQDIYIPLQFWFTKKLNLAYPLISEKNTLKINIKLRNFEEVVTYDGLTPPDYAPIIDSGIYLDYYLLGSDEQKTYQQEPQKYLIDQWQNHVYEINENTGISKYLLDFRKAIKELVFVFVENESVNNNDYFNYGQRINSGVEFIQNVTLLFDNRERFIKLPESYLRSVTTQKYHSFAGDRNIYCLSFAEIPEINQPTGSANFSRYDRIEITIEFVPNVPPCKLYMLGISYNHLIVDNIRGTTLEYLT